MLSLADSRSLFLISEYLEEDEVCCLIMVGLTNQTCRSIHKKLTSVAKVEIRLLKARSKAAEDCLRFLTIKPSANDFPQLDFPMWWLPMPLHVVDYSAYRLQFINNQPRGLLRIARAKKTGKQLQKLDKKLQQLDSIVPVEVADAHQVKDYYKDLGQLSIPGPKFDVKKKQPEPPYEPGELQADHMFGYNFCPVKYLRAAGSKLQSLKLKLTH